MNVIEEINGFFSKYGDQFDLKTINYTKQLVHRIKTSDVLKNFLSKNKISASMLLNEIVSYSDFKLVKYGNEKLDLSEIQSVLNIILFSNELEELIMKDHVEISSIGQTGELFYTPDQFTVDYFMGKYEIELEEDVEFDFTILDGKDIGEIENGFDFGIN